MLSLFGRRFWMIRLLGIATASALAGSAASSALALLIVDRAASAFATTDAADEIDEDDEEPEVLAKTTVKPKPTARGAFGRQAAGATLDAYNPFCPTCEPAKPSPELLAQGGGALPGVATVPTKLPLRLHVTMEAERAADSLATIYDVERNVVGVYGVGDALREGVTVVAVSYGKVELRTPTGTELLELGKPVTAPKTEAKVEPKESKSDAKAKPMAESPDLDAIQCATADVCTVERAFVDEILANPAKFASQAPRVAPLPDGGFKLAGVRKGSLAHKLGLASGDILLAVNGTELKGLDDALGLMTKLRRASNLEVTLDRKGTAVRKQIEIK